MSDLDVRHANKLTLKKIVRRMLGEVAVGILDYFRHPEMKTSWGGAFNGQVYRRRMFQEIVDGRNPIAIIETGTYRGSTTEFMAETGLPVYTVEGHPRNYGFAYARLWRKRNVTIQLGDSRAALRSLFAGPLRSSRDATTFVYLDAHWNEDLPLAEEIGVVFQERPNAIVMVDDFQVADDTGYAYDDYGPGKALTLEYIAAAIQTHSLVAYYPAIPAAQESGLRRGCVVLARAEPHAEALSSLHVLRSARVGG